MLNHCFINRFIVNLNDAKFPDAVMLGGAYEGGEDLFIFNENRTKVHDEKLKMYKKIHTKAVKHINTQE